MPVSENLRTIRKKKKLTQQELARISGVSQQAISFLENGRNTANEGTLKLLAKALDCTAAELMGEGQGDDQPRLTQEEQEILAAYRKASPDRRQIVRDVLRVRGFEEETAAI